MYVPTYSYVHVFTYTHSFLYSCVYVCMYAHMLPVRHVTYLTCHMFICYVSTCSWRTPVHMITSLQAHMFIRARVPTTYGHAWSLVTWPRIHLITQCSPVLLYTHVLLICSRVHLFIVPCAHMACTHDIACPHTHTPMYTHWFTLSHNHRYTCALIRYVCMLERFHMFPPSVPNWKGG